MNDHSFLGLFSCCRSLNYFLLIMLSVAAQKIASHPSVEHQDEKWCINDRTAIDAANKIVPVHEEACAAHVRSTTAKHSTA